MMEYITDKYKNITHVVVSIEQWNKILGDQLLTVNPYEPVLSWLKDKTQIGHITLRSALGGVELMPTDPVQPYSVIYGRSSFSDAKGISVAYILRNNDFYTALANTKTGVSDADRATLSSFGFDVDLFLSSASKRLLGVVHSENRRNFISDTMMNSMGDYFDLTIIHRRLRLDAEVLRLFFFDVFEILRETLDVKPDFIEIFKKYSLVDKLAKDIYPENTYSGSTSRVYKANKEAKKIIGSGWREYVTPNIQSNS